MKKFSHIFDLCATIDSDNPDPEQISQHDIRLAFLSRLGNITIEEGTEPFGVVDVISNDDDDKKEEEGVVGLFTTHPPKRSIRHLNGFLLSDAGWKAFQIINNFLISKDIKVPDDLKFVSKAEWKTLDMPHCNNAELVVLGYHGQTRGVFSLDGLNYKLNDRFQEMLQQHNLWFEEGCSTYGGVYTSPSDKI